MYLLNLEMYLVNLEMYFLNLEMYLLNLEMYLLYLEMYLEKDSDFILLLTSFNLGTRENLEMYLLN